MNVPLALGSIAASIYLAARHRGLGKPLEEQPQTKPVGRFSDEAEMHENRAVLFLRMAQSAVGRASEALALDECRKAYVLLTAARSAVSHMKSHTLFLPDGEQRRSLVEASKQVEEHISRVGSLHQARCVVSSVVA